MVGLLALEYDHPGAHGSTAPGFVFSQAAYDDLLDRVSETSPQANYAYRTRGGARLLYVLAEPILPEHAEQVHHALVERLANGAGLVACDSAVWDWTRLMRLPNVDRPGPGGTLASPVKVLNATAPLDALALFPYDPTRARNPAGAVVLDNDSIDPTLPEESEALALVWTRNNTPTPWARAAAARLVGRDPEHLPLTFTPPPIPEPRNTTLMSWCGSICTMLFGRYDTSPLHVYGLLLQAVNASVAPEDAAKGRNLQEEAWKIVRYCWSREILKAAARKAETQDRVAHLLSVIENEWPTRPEDFDNTPEWLLSRLICAAGPSKFYALGPGGFYQIKKLNRASLVAGLRHAGLAPRPGSGEAGLIETERDTKAGGSMARSPEAILADHAFPVEDTIQGVLQGAPTQDLWLDRAGRLARTMYYRRTDLDIGYQAEVDEWLRKLAGTQAQYEKLCKWIALALAFERGPICALSITGWPGVGKDLLVNGLAECLLPGDYATGDAFGKWQYCLDHTPFIWVDEGWPAGAGRVDETFRKLVAGGRVEMKLKHLGNVKVEHWPRLILTANTNDLVKKLFSHRDLTESDQRAIAVRLCHLNVPADAAKWLDKKGNHAHTAGWIKGAAPSRFTVARHFLHLYETLGQAGGACRFLMENATDPAVLRDLLFTSSESHVKVGAVVLEMASRGSLTRDQQGGWWTSPKQVLDHVSLHGNDWAGRSLTLVGVGKVLSALIRPGSARSFVDANGEVFRGWELCPQKLKSIADEHGYEFCLTSTTTESGGGL
jgi:hypothetical protein